MRHLFALLTLLVAVQPADASIVLPPDGSRWQREANVPLIHADALALVASWNAADPDYLAGLGAWVMPAHSYADAACELQDPVARGKECSHAIAALWYDWNFQLSAIDLWLSGPVSTGQVLPGTSVNVPITPTARYTATDVETDIQAWVLDPRGTVARWEATPASGGPLPEPGTLALLGAGLLVMVAGARR